MPGTLILLLITSLLQATDCNKFEVNLPQTVQVKKGSCVTVPCSFQIKSDYEKYLNDTCEAKWVFNADLAPQLAETNPVTGILTRKNCTTTFTNMQPHYSKAYNFRLDCKNNLKYTFTNKKVTFKVTDHFPSPTLTPSTLKIREGESVSLTCSAPASCLPHTPTLTWTPTLGDIHETIQENQDKTKLKTSVLNFTASHHHHHGQNISCTAAYKKQDGSPDVSFTTSLMPDVLYISQILHSSNCIQTSNQVNCSCETVGNPLPTTHWYLNEQPVNQSSQVVVTNELLNSSHLRSIITLNEPQDRDLSTLLCFSSNSFGSAIKQFGVSCIESSRKNLIQMPVFIATVAAFLFIVCILLFIVRFQNTHSKRKRITVDTDTVAVSQHLMKEKNEVQNPNEDAIYANSEEFR